MSGNSLCENRLKRRLDQFVHKRGRCVVGAGKLPRRAFDLFSVAVAEETEGPGRDVHIYDRLKFKQTFVDRAEFLSAHIPVVDAHKCAPAAEEAETADGFEKPFIGYGCAVQCWALIGAEQSAQSRQP